MNQTTFSIDAFLSNPTVSVILIAMTGLSFLISSAIVAISYVKGNKEIIAQVSMNLGLSLLAYSALLVQHIMKQIGYHCFWLKYFISALMSFIFIYDLLSVCAWTRSTSHLSKTGSRTDVIWTLLFLLLGLPIASSTTIFAYFFEDITFHVLETIDLRYTVIFNLLLVLVNELFSVFHLSLAYRGQFIPIKSMRDYFLTYFDILNAATNQPDKKTIPILIYCSWNAVWKTPFLFMVGHWMKNQEKYQIIIITFNIITIVFNIIQFKAKKERSRRLKIFKRLVGLNTVDTYAPNQNSQCFFITLPKSNRVRDAEERKRAEQEI